MVQPPTPYEATSPSAPPAPSQTPPNKTTPTEPRNYGSYNSQVCSLISSLLSVRWGLFQHFHLTVNVQFRSYVSLDETWIKCHLSSDALFAVLFFLRLQ